MNKTAVSYVLYDMRTPIIKAKDITHKKLNFAKSLRQEMTHTEKVFWARVRAKQYKGLKFRRQQVVGPFIVDFYCAELRTAIELDGPQHKEQEEYDRARDKEIEGRGIRVLRFTNEEVIGDIEGVLDKISSLAPP